MRKANKTELSDTQKSVLFTFLSNLSILKVYNKEFLKSKSFCPSLFSFHKHFLSWQLKIYIIQKRNSMID